MNLANTLFVGISAILVLMMTPGMAFFYGGLVSKKNVVNTLVSIFFIIAIAVVLWFAIGYSLSFSGDNLGVIGDFYNLFLHHFDGFRLTGGKIPMLVNAIFQMMFSIITPALFVGAIVGRMRFKFLLSFITLWLIFIYYPMVHMVWGNGILSKLGTLDFAGGTVVHINAGITALVLAIFLGRRKNYDKPIHHYNLSWVLMGTTLLWLGWYGFNAGSALAIDNVGIQAIFTTTLAPATSMMTWFILDYIVNKHTNLSGLCNGTLCGLVGVTPATGFVTLTGAFWIGIISTLCSYFVINYLKPRLKVDDTLDAFGCHGVSGIIGSIATGLFATKAINPTVTSNGLFYGGGFHQLLIQLGATIFTIIFVAVIASIIILILKLIMPMRVDAKSEEQGLDVSEHHENIGM